MGLVKFLWRFIKDLSGVEAPLTKLTKKDRCIQKWDSISEDAFETSKKSISSTPILSSPDWNKPFSGHVDASKLAASITCKLSFTPYD